MKTARVPPFRPPEDPCPRILVLDHSIVQCTNREYTEAAAHLGDPEQAIHRLCQTVSPQAPAMTALEIAARLGYPRAVTTTALTLLAQQGLVRVNDPRRPVPTGQVRQVLHALRTGPGDPPAARSNQWSVHKILVTGGPRTGKTSLIGAASDHPPTAITEEVPLRPKTDAEADDAEADSDACASCGAPSPHACASCGAPSPQPPEPPLEERTRALQVDAGRIHVGERHELVLTGAPLPGSWDGLWPDVARGAHGALVLVAPDRVEEAFPALEHLEEANLPYQVLISHLHGTEPDAQQVSQVLEVAPAQVTVCDTRNRPSARAALGDVFRQSLKGNVQ